MAKVEDQDHAEKPSDNDPVVSEGPRKRSLEKEGETSLKRVKPNVPEGMSKREWKRQLKLKQREETKEEYKQKKREKRRAAKGRRRERIKEAKIKIDEQPKDKADETDSDEHGYHQLKKPKINAKDQIPSGIKIVMDCDFDLLMNNKEIVSLSNQISRAYSAQRHCHYQVQLDISSFNKNLKLRFDTAIPQYKLWTGINFIENDKLDQVLPIQDSESLQKCIYLTADTDEEIESLEPGYTYIVGGIVDKNRHKNLCVNKAKLMGLRTARLPIGKYIKLNGRQVLATSHVFEICCKWLELDHSWAKAFNEILPPRKLVTSSVSVQSSPSLS